MGHLPLVLVTLNSQWKIGILTWAQGATMNQEAGGRWQTKDKATKLGRTKPQVQTCTAIAQLCVPMAIICWPTADPSSNSDD